jgi:hypothetical protein
LVCSFHRNIKQDIPLTVFFLSSEYTLTGQPRTSTPQPNRAWMDRMRQHRYSWKFDTQYLKRPTYPISGISGSIVIMHFDSFTMIVNILVCYDKRSAARKSAATLKDPGLRGCHMLGVTRSIRFNIFGAVGINLWYPGRSFNYW